MNWNNLNKTNCPHCDKKLQFRVKGTRNNIRSRQGRAFDENFYFCFKCNFQISASKLMLISKKTHRDAPSVLKTGYLSY